MVPGCFSRFRAAQKHGDHPHSEEEAAGDAVHEVEFLPKPAFYARQGVQPVVVHPLQGEAKNGHQHHSQYRPAGAGPGRDGPVEKGRHNAWGKVRELRRHPQEEVVGAVGRVGVPSGPDGEYDHAHDGQAAEAQELLFPCVGVDVFLIDIHAEQGGCRVHHRVHRGKRRGGKARQDHPVQADTGRDHGFDQFQEGVVGVEIHLPEARLEEIVRRDSGGYGKKRDAEL